MEPIKPFVSRRHIVKGAAAAGGGLALGLDLRGQFTAAQAQTATVDELGVWVVIMPTEKVVVRIARSEMGQGTLTGLAQLVAEELECDWKNVGTEMPSPGQSLARKRAWGEMGTGGSRGIRTSELYVRQGGAVARTMLLQAAANDWQVPVGDLTVDKGVISHTASKRMTTYSKVAAAKLPVPDPKSMTLARRRWRSTHEHSRLRPRLSAWRRRRAWPATMYPRRSRPCSH